MWQISLFEVNKCSSELYLKWCIWQELALWTFDLCQNWHQFRLRKLLFYLFTCLIFLLFNVTLEMEITFVRYWKSRARSTTFKSGTCFSKVPCSHWSNKINARFSKFNSRKFPLISQYQIFKRVQHITKEPIVKGHSEHIDKLSVLEVHWTKFIFIIDFAFNISNH